MKARCFLFLYNWSCQVLSLYYLNPTYFVHEFKQKNGPIQ
uniref:Uncharacterized protein n=1 Tax=Rhizophora mucronata TaxID=61149 RepID=A0A2P2PTS4_RHIMU